MIGHLTSRDVIATKTALTPERISSVVVLVATNMIASERSEESGEMGVVGLAEMRPHPDSSSLRSSE